MNSPPRLFASVIVGSLAGLFLLRCGEQPKPREIRRPIPKPEPAYVAPPEGTKSLVESLMAKRDDRGAVIIEGKALLPRNTKIVVDVYAGRSRKGKDLVGESKTVVGFQSAFNAGPFEIPKSGTYTVQVTSFFNEIWQSPEILSLVGREGVNLPRSALDLNDPEFPQQGGYLWYAKTVQIGSLPPAARAIHAVKSSKLYVKGKGKAVDTVGQIVAFFNKPGLEFKPGEWRAEQTPSGTWKVSLDHTWESEKKVANWEYDPKTGQVKYLDPEAKMLSWIPAE